MIENPYATLKIRDFPLLLAGRILVTIAWQIQSIAVGWQIYALTKNPLALGLAGLAEAFPAIGISLYAGHIADVIDRRLIVLLASLTLCLSFALLGSSTVFLTNNGLLVILIFALIALTGFARGFYGPAVFGIVSDIIPRELFGNAAAWTSTAWQGSAVAGPVIGGILYVTFGAAVTYFTAAVLAMSSFLFFLCIKTRTTLRSKQDIKVASQIKEGLDFVFSNEIILGAMALDLFAVLFGGAVALLPIFTAEVFHMGPQALGMLRAAPSVGAFLSVIVLTHRPIANNAGVVFMTAVAGFGLCMVAFGLSTNFYLSFFLLATSGALDGISVWVRTTIYQLLTPNDMKGRVAAVNSIFIGSSNEIGAFESGVAAKLMGLVPSVVFGGCMTLLVVLITIFKAPKLRELHMQSLYKAPISQS